MAEGPIELKVIVATGGSDLMNQTAIYQTKLPKRRFELFDDSIRATGSKGNVDFDITFPLSKLDSGFERIWLHSASFYIGVWIVLIDVFMLFAFVAFVEMQDFHVSLSKPLGLIGGIGSVGFFLALFSRRKIEYIQFRTDSGLAVLGIPNNRKASGEFNRFVDLLIERINKVHAASSSGST